MVERIQIITLLRAYGTKCSGCSEYLVSSDWVQRARDLIFHMACFRCYVCKNMLYSGDTVVVKEDLVVCFEHKDASLFIDEVDNLSVSSMDSDSRSSDFDERAARRPRSVELDIQREPAERGGERPRANFTPDQLQTLQASFNQKSMPTGEELEMLAHRLGLAKKTVCIWFQNARARCKNLQMGGAQVFRKSGKSSRFTNSPVQTILIE